MDAEVFNQKNSNQRLVACQMAIYLNKTQIWEPLCRLSNLDSRLKDLERWARY